MGTETLTAAETRQGTPAALAIPPRWWSAALVLLLALLPFGVFWAEALGLQLFFHHDLQYYFFPYHKLVADIVAQGRLPLWNPYAFSGIPLLGDGQTAILYPPNWLFFVLPAAHALTVVVLLQFSIAGVGMFGYVRGLGLSRLAALAAALAFMFNGFLVARVVHLSIMAGAALIPAVFWGVDRLLARRSVGAFVLAAALVGAQSLAGHPQVPIYTAVGLGVYVLVIAARRWRRTRRAAELSPVLWLGGSYLVGYGLAAIQLAPWIEFATFSPRAAGASYEFVTFQSLAGWDWLLFLFPYGYGGLQQSWLQSLPGWDLPVYLWERLAYVGLLPLALALVGLIRPRRARQTSRDDPARLLDDRRWALAAVLVVLLLIAAGSSTPFGRLIYALPVIGKLRAYARAVAVAIFALAALAAYGVERLHPAARRPSGALKADRTGLLAGLLVLELVGGALLLANLLGPERLLSAADEPMYRVMLGRALQLGEANAQVPLLLALVSAGVLWWLARRRSWPAAGALLGLVALDLLSFAATFNPTTSPAAFAGTPPSVAFLQRDPALFRTASFVRDDRIPPEEARAQLAISWAIPFGIEDINGFNSLQPRRYTDVLFGPHVEDVSYGFLNDPRLLAPDNALLALLDVRYVLVQRQSSIVPPAPAPQDGIAADPEQRSAASWTRVYQDQLVTIYRNPRSFGRAFFAEQVAAVHDARTILALITQPGFDPRRVSFVEQGLTQDVAGQLSGSGPATVRVERIAPDELRLHTRTDAPRLLVLSEMWLPGWRAELDGRALPIYRTNYLFRGVAVPAGEHTIRMVYRPTSALLGASITAATLLGLALALLIHRRLGRIRE